MACSVLSETNPALTDTVLGLMRAFDGSSMRSIAYNSLHRTGTMKLPASCQDKRVLRDLLKHRLATIGQVRMVFDDEIINEMLDGKGRVNCGTIGPFALDYQDARDARAYHRPTDDYAPIDSDLQVKVGCGWDLDNNWSDAE